ncbi:hypothetical protein F2Q70_00030534 [Brassica cretica]|uniref:Uncharacterized protein n=1 Tax=Brassica cretica TaxID=69181 RepID=A0A8S9FG03_BRACR|nr:hypothetical protein F2Q70_00030534 [Brassica cretica]
MQLDTQKHVVSQYLQSAHANRHAEARVLRCMNTRHAEGQVDVEVSSGMVPKDCLEEKEGTFQVLICPDQFIQDIEVGFWGLTSWYQDKDLEGIKRVPDIGGGFQARIAGPV